LLSPQSTLPICCAFGEQVATAQPATHPLLDVRSDVRDVDMRGAKGRLCD
jgi:hypothetical protein